MEVASTPRGKANNPWRNPWVVGWLALVAVVLVANVTMVVLAISTNPGLVVEDYYERGRDYAQNRAAQRRAQPDDWQVRLDVPQSLRPGVPAGVRLAAQDARGLPIHADRAHIFVYRPADAEADFEVPMVVEAPGVLGAEVTFPLQGIWDLIVQVESGDKVYDTARRIAVRRD